MRTLTITTLLLAAFVGCSQQESVSSTEWRFEHSNRVAKLEGKVELLQSQIRPIPQAPAKPEKAVDESIHMVSLTKQVDEPELTESAAFTESDRLDAIEARLTKLEQTSFAPVSYSAAPAVVSEPIVSAPVVSVSPTYSGGSTGNYSATSSNWGATSQPVSSFGSNGGYSSRATPVYRGPARFVPVQTMQAYSGPVRQQRAQRAAPVRAAFSAARQATTYNRQCDANGI